MCHPVPVLHCHPRPCLFLPVCSLSQLLHLPVSILAQASPTPMPSFLLRSFALSSFTLEMLRVAGLEVTTQRATAGTPSLPQSLKVLCPGEGGQWGREVECLRRWHGQGKEKGVCLLARLAFSTRGPDYLGSNNLLPVLYNSWKPLPWNFSLIPGLSRVPEVC